MMQEVVYTEGKAHLEGLVKKSIGAWSYDAIQAILKERNRIATQKQKEEGSLFARDTQQEDLLLKQMVDLYDTIAIKALRQYVGYALVGSKKKDVEQLKAMGTLACEEICRYASHWLKGQLQPDNEQRWIALLQVGVWANVGDFASGCFSTNWLVPLKAEMETWTALPDLKFSEMLGGLTWMECGVELVDTFLMRWQKLLIGIWLELLRQPGIKKKQELLLACAEMEEILEAFPTSVVLNLGTYRERFLRRSLYYALRDWFHGTNHLVTFAVQLHMEYFEDGTEETMKSVIALLVVRNLTSAAEWFQRCNMYDPEGEVKKYSDVSKLLYWMAAYSKVAF